MHPDVEVEESAVAFGDAVADVRAVVVKGGHASFAAAAVFGAEGLFDVADGAVFVFDVELDFVVGLEDFLLMVVDAGFGVIQVEHDGLIVALGLRKGGLVGFGVLGFGWGFGFGDVELFGWLFFDHEAFEVGDVSSVMVVELLVAENSFDFKVVW